MLAKPLGEQRNGKPAGDNGFTKVEAAPARGRPQFNKGGNSRREETAPNARKGREAAAVLKEGTEESKVETERIVKEVAGNASE